MDPKDLSDEELLKAANGEEIKPEEEPANPPQEEKEKPEEVVEEQEQPQEEHQAEEEQAEAPPMSRREQLRVADLLKKYGPPQETSEVKGVDFRDKVQADEEVYKTLEDTTRQYGQQQFNQGLETAKSIQFHTRLEIDAPRVEAKYPRLDPNNDQFDPVAANDMNTLYLRIVGYNPQTDSVANPELRYADFVEAHMGLASRLAAEQVVESSKNIAKQAANTGIRPDGSSAKRLNLNKPPEQMTDEELKAVIAQSGM